jgi:cytochrome c peroxidase
VFTGRAQQRKDIGIPRYHDYFSKAFPGQGDPVTLANVQKSIAVFEATLITPNAPFDRFLDGKADALSAKQQDGLSLFMRRAARAATMASMSAAACTRRLASSRNPAPNCCRPPIRVG